jgi:hypothetical protein
MTAVPAPDPGEFSEWIKTHSPPDLQELVARHGGYNKITPEAWAEWDAANEAWQAARKARLRRGGTR